MSHFLLPSQITQIYLDKKKQYRPDWASLPGILSGEVVVHPSSSGHLYLGIPPKAENDVKKNESNISLYLRQIIRWFDWLTTG